MKRKPFGVSLDIEQSKEDDFKITIRADDGSDDPLVLTISKRSVNALGRLISLIKHHD
jgi:hypothetical protein